jgi:hypothetical protein
MLLLLLAIIVLVILVLKNHSSDKQAQNTNSLRKQILVSKEVADMIRQENNEAWQIKHEQELIEASEKLPEPFRNNFGKKACDYSFLTPEEAEDEFLQRKARGEWLSTEEYRGYQDTINAKYDEPLIAELNGLAAEEANDWFRNKVNLGSKMGVAVWKAAHKKISPVHERILLEMMSTIGKNKIESWVKAQKKEGYFFSDVAYAKAYEIYTRPTKSYYQPANDKERKKLDTIKRGIRRNRQKMNENPLEKKYKKLYEEYLEDYRLLTGEPYEKAL